MRNTAGGHQGGLGLLDAVELGLDQRRIHAEIMAVFTDVTGQIDLGIDVLIIVALQPPQHPDRQFECVGTGFDFQSPRFTRLTQKGAETGASQGCC